MSSVNNEVAKITFESCIQLLESLENTLKDITYKSCIQLLESFENSLKDIKDSLLNGQNRAVIAYQIGTLHSSIVHSITLFRDTMEGKVIIKKHEEN